MQVTTFALLFSLLICFVSASEFSDYQKIVTQELSNMKTLENESNQDGPRERKVFLLDDFNCAYLSSLSRIWSIEVNEFLSILPSELDLELTDKVKEFISSHNQEIAANLLMADEKVFASKYKFFRNYPALFETFLDSPYYSSEFKAAKITAFINAIPSDQLNIDDGFIKKFVKPVNVHFTVSQILSIVLKAGFSEADFSGFKFNHHPYTNAVVGIKYVPRNMERSQIEWLKVLLL